MLTYYRIYHICSGLDVAKVASAAQAYMYIYKDIINNEKLPEQYKALNLNDLEVSFAKSKDDFYGGRLRAVKVEEV